MTDEQLHFVPLIARGERFSTPYWLTGPADALFAGLVPVGVEPQPDDMRPTIRNGGEVVVECGAWLTPGPHQLVIAAFGAGGELLDLAFPGVVMVTASGDPAL